MATLVLVNYKWKERLRKQISPVENNPLDVLSCGSSSPFQIVLTQYYIVLSSAHCPVYWFLPPK